MVSLPGLRSRKTVPARSAGELDAMAAAGAVVASALRAVQAAAVAGMSTHDLDQIAETVIREAGAIPSFLGYHGFPATICSSVNDRVVHGIPVREEILAHGPDGVMLSNGPGDPAATGLYAVPQIRRLVAAGKPVFGICLGHQMLALALGARTEKMEQGHHGANHPVKDLTTGKVEIVSMNHGFTVDRDSLPDAVVETHVSLFDGTNCGIALKDRPVFSVQHHPEASPGPTDSLYLFQRFADLISSRP